MGNIGTLVYEAHTAAREEHSGEVDMAFDAISGRLFAGRGASGACVEWIILRARLKVLVKDFQTARPVEALG